MAEILQGKKYGYGLAIRIGMMQSNQEVERESSQSNRPLPGLPSAELPKKNTNRSNESLLSKFRDQFSDRHPESISPEEILSFLVGLNGFPNVAAKASGLARREPGIERREPILKGPAWSGRTIGKPVFSGRGSAGCLPIGTVVPPRS
jgi:hypothetical protein